MQYSIIYEADKDYILITINGEIEDRIMQTAIREAGQVIVEHNCNKILGDFRNATFKLNTMAIIGLYKFWIDSLKQNGISPFKAKRVILLNQDQETTENFHFFETISLNRSQQVKILFNKDEAIAWLTGN